MYVSNQLRADHREVYSPAVHVLLWRNFITLAF